jgi:hypothetical protein
LAVQSDLRDAVFRFIEKTGDGLLDRHAEHFALAFDLATLIETELCLHRRKQSLRLEFRAVFYLEATHVIELSVRERGQESQREDRTQAEKTSSAVIHSCLL